MFVASRIQENPLLDRLDTFCTERQIPLRVLVPRDGQTAQRNAAWTSEQVSAATPWDRNRRLEGRREQCEAEGVTLWFGATFSHTLGRTASMCLRSERGGATTQEVRHSYVSTSALPRELPMTPMWVAIDETAHRSTRLRYNDNTVALGELVPHAICEWLRIDRYPAEYDVVHSRMYDAITAAILQVADPEWVAGEQARQEAAEMEMLSSLGNARIINRVAEIRRQISEYESTYLNYVSESQRFQELLNAEQRILDGVIRQVEDEQHTGVNQVTQEFQALKQHGRIESVRLDVESNALVITTTDDFRLTRPDTGESRWLGQFEISIMLDTSVVQIRNLSTTRQGRAHPHVNGVTPCFGGHEADFRNLINNRELGMFFELLCQYLETLNLRDSWGGFGAYWFEVPDERPLDTDEQATTEETAEV